MKIATNVHRDAFGGITISNLALFDWMEDKDDTFAGIDFARPRHILGAIIFRRYLPSFFTHHIINAIDILPRFPWEKRGNLRKNWGVLVETAKKVLRKENPDVVLINGTYYAPWILARAAQELGIPIVLRYAGILQQEIQHNGWLVRRRLLIHEQWIAKSANVIIYPSSLCRTIVERDILGHATKHGVVIPNPTKATSTNGKRRGRFTIAAIGRWTKIKNFQAFIALHEELLRILWPHRAVMVTSYWDEQFG